VVSFLALRRELVEHGAPRDLVDGALRAARDEVIHARLCGRLAQRRGGVLRRVRSRRVATRDLETIARENAVEGCVRETWAAVVASHQARYAEHPEVRAIFMRIADDEIRHAELARSIDLWARSVLDDAAQARVDAARRQARRDLEERMGQPSSVLVRQAGLPPLRRARRLVRGLRPALDAPV
jgi:hypothetical protein